MPKRCACCGVNGLKSFRIIAKEDQTSTGRHRSSPRVPSTGLGITPGKAARVNAKSQQDFLTIVARSAFRASGIELAALGELLWLSEIYIAVLESHYVKQTSMRVV